MEASSAAQTYAQMIRTAFAAYQARFHVITRRARERFATRDWHGMRADATERLMLYREVIDRTEQRIRQRVGDRLHDKALWRHIRTAYSRCIADRPDAELAETFFNSVTRRIFNTVGVDPRIEFVTTDSDDSSARASITHVFEHPASTAAFAHDLLEACALSGPFRAPSADARRMARFIDRALTAQGQTGPLRRAEVLRPVFYRGIGAYLVGCLQVGDTMVPLAVAVHNHPEGMAVDAVLLDEDAISILFSFARSYFHVDTHHPNALVRFLKRILPRKRIAELYIAIGYNKHGKTELYRDLLHHFSTTTDRFVQAPGQRGMVMTVFTMASYDMVFKVIKDRFDPPKTTTRRDVKERYRLVFQHDRAGRLVDAQEFEHLRLSRRLFSDDLLETLLNVAGSTVHLDDHRVIIDHCYVERRVTPLDLFVRTQDEADARAALLEYGDAIKDLIRTNIFPGDLLLKNFGVTRHGRVVFYDYDELGFVTDYDFRRKPKAQTHLEEMSAEAWFYVGPDDVFPEEFQVTMGVSDALMEAFVEAHGELFTAEYWTDVKTRIQEGAILPILPYPPRKRLPHRRKIPPDALTTPAYAHG